MSFKFRKRVRIFPGFTLNLSKSGMSATVGMRGLSVNIGEKGNYLNVGIPGTGIYDRIRLDDGGGNELPTIPSDNHTLDVVPTEHNIPVSATEIKSFNPELITSQGLFGLKETIVNAEQDKRQLYSESLQAQSEANSAKMKMILSKILIFGFFTKSFEDKYKICQADADEAKKTHDEFKVSIDFNFDNAIRNDYITLKKSFEQLLSSCAIWDVTAEEDVDRFRTRSAAYKTIYSEVVAFEMASLDFINTKYVALKMRNVKGGDLFVYPGFVAIKENSDVNFGLLDYRDLGIEHFQITFIETRPLLPDAKVVDKTWKYVNKNGLPDKRFKDNYEIPIVLYYQLNMSSKTGLRERYMFSNPNIGAAFCTAFQNYRDILAKLNWAADNNEQKQVLAMPPTVSNDNKHLDISEMTILKFVMDRIEEARVNTGENLKKISYLQEIQRAGLQLYADEIFETEKQIFFFIRAAFDERYQGKLSDELFEELSLEVGCDTTKLKIKFPRYTAAFDMALGKSKEEAAKVNEVDPKDLNDEYVEQFRILVRKWNLGSIENDTPDEISNEYVLNTDKAIRSDVDEATILRYAAEYIVNQEDEVYVDGLMEKLPHDKFDEIMIAVAHTFALEEITISNANLEGSSKRSIDKIAHDSKFDARDFTAKLPKYQAALAIAMGIPKKDVIKKYTVNPKELTAKYIAPFKTLLKLGRFPKYSDSK